MHFHNRLVEKISEDRMGVVWKAVDTTLDREAKVLASLNHSNLATVLCFRDDGGVKVLDFGLAKAIAGDPTPSAPTSPPPEWCQRSPAWVPSRGLTADGRKFPVNAALAATTQASPFTGILSWPDKLIAK